MLFLALVVALVLPGAVGKRVAGTATSEAIAPPPSVGDCVTEITGKAVASPNGQSAAVTIFPVATVVPSCRGAVIGEIISVQPTTTSTVSTLTEYDQAHPSCRSQVEKYLGTSASATISGVQWTKSIDVDAITVGPDVHDRTAGRTWTACVMAAVAQTYVANASLKSSWITDTLPDAFGLCWAQGVVQHGVPTNCTVAHSTQQIGSGFVVPPTDSGTSIVSAAAPDTVAASCRTLAASVMKTSDPTRGGQLAVAVIAQPAGAPYVQCVVSVVGAAKLTGSLIGIGSKALPFS